MKNAKLTGDVSALKVGILRLVSDFEKQWDGTAAVKSIEVVRTPTGGISKVEVNHKTTR